MAQVPLRPRCLGGWHQRFVARCHGTISALWGCQLWRGSTQQVIRTAAQHVFMVLKWLLIVGDLCLRPHADDAPPAIHHSWSWLIVANRQSNKATQRIHHPTMHHYASTCHRFLSPHNLGLLANKNPWSPHIWICWSGWCWTWCPEL